MKLERWDWSEDYPYQLPYGDWCASDDVKRLEESHKELLEALKALLKFHDDGDYDGPDPAELALAAIAKAERASE